MARVYGPRPELGYRLLHGHESPIPTMPSFSHVSETVCTADHAFASHSHEVFELCYVLSGKGERDVAGERIMVGPGDLCIVRPGERHAARADRDDPYHVFAIAFQPDRLSLGAAQDVGLPPDCLQVLGERIVHGVGGAEHIIRRIIVELDRVDADPRLRELTALQVKLLVLELLVLGSRCAVARSAVERSALSSRAPRRKAFVELLSWLSTRLSAPPSVPEMAARVGLTPAHFSVTFRREVGTTPVAYLLGLRSEEAARRLLAQRSRSITAIAYELGFPSSQYFSQVFRENTGMTPSQWRKSRADRT